MFVLVFDLTNFKKDSLNQTSIIDKQGKYASILFGTNGGKRIVSHCLTIFSAKIFQLKDCKFATFVLERLLSKCNQCPVTFMHFVYLTFLPSLKSSNEGWLMFLTFHFHKNEHLIFCVNLLLMLSFQLP